MPTAGECKMNLRRPSSESLQNEQNAYTYESGNPKFLSLSHYKLCENSCDPKAKPLVWKYNLKVYPVAFGNDATALKPSIQLDERAEVNIGLEDKIRLECAKENLYMSKKELEHGIVTETLVWSIAGFDNNCSFPVEIKNSTKISKKGNDMKSFFTEQIKIL